MSEQIDFLKYRALLQEWGYELCRTRETVYIRRRPRTRDQPTPPMMRARNVLGFVSSANQGTKGFDPQGMPLVCSKNREGIHVLMAPLEEAKRLRRIELARKVADAIGLESVEKAELVALVRGTRP